MNTARKPKSSPTASLMLDRSALIGPLSAAAALATGKIIPILGHVRLDADGDTLRISASDLEMWIVQSIQIPAVAEPFSVCVEAPRLNDLVRRLPDGADIRMELGTNGFCRVESGESRYRLPVLSNEEFPVIAAPASAKTFTIGIESLHSMLAQARVSVCVTENRPQLAGIHFRTRRDGETDLLCIESTDGVRLSRIDADLPASAAELQGFVLPRKAIEYFLKFLTGKGEARIEVGETLVSLTVNGNIFRSKLVDGAFPDCDGVILTETDATISLNRLVFLKAVERLNAFQTDRKKERALKFEIADGKLSLSTPGDGDGKELLTASATGIPRFGVNPQFVIDVLSHIEGEQVLIECLGNSSPIRFRDAADSRALHLIMPMRV